MKIATLLHFYQPHNQQADILDRIVNESYRPLTEGLLKSNRGKLVVNISAVLSQLLVEKGYTDVIENMKDLAKRGQIEFTDSAVYHAFLPLLPESEVKRQIEQNRAINKEIFGDDVYDPVGFFPPEMSINEHVLKIISEENYKWVSVPKVAFPDGRPSGSKLYYYKDTSINLFFRQKRVSALVLSALVRGVEQLIEETKDLHNDKYWFLVMDAETFGHHRIGHEKVLFEIMENDFFEPVLIKDLIDMEGIEKEETDIRPSTWTNDEQDFWLDKEKTQKTTAKSFILWDDPSNPIHKVQWKLTNYAIKLVNSFDDKKSKKWIEAREKLDMALASDQYWWASAKPWWSLEMIEQGAYALKNVIITLFGTKDSKEAAKAEKYYREILDLAFKWQREGYIRKRHLEDSGTFMKQPFKDRTPPEWYNQILLEFEDQMDKAAKNREYEKAIKWRDAVKKLDQGTDIYDVLHVVDELWSSRTIPSVKPFLSHNWDELPDFVKKYLKNVKSKEDFENWKKQSKLKK